MALKRRKKEEMPKLSKEEQARVDKFVEYLFLAFIILAVICTIIVYKTKNPGMATDYMNSATVEGYYENSFKPYKSLDVTHLNYDVDDLNYEIYFPDDIVGKENQDKYPLIIFANSNKFKCKDIKPVMAHLASYGFVCVGNNGENYNGDDLKKVIDHLKYLSDEDVESIFYQKIDKEKIGLYGTYDGAVNAVKLYEKLDDSSLRINYLVLSCLPKEESLEKLKLEKYDLSKVYSNTFLISSDNSKLKKVLDTDDAFSKLTHALTKIKATRNNIKLSSMLSYQDPYMTAYFMCFMKNDEEARKIFYDSDEKAEITGFSGEWYNVEIDLGM